VDARHGFAWSSRDTVGTLTSTLDGASSWEWVADATLTELNMEALSATDVLVIGRGSTPGDVNIEHLFASHDRGPLLTTAIRGDDDDEHIDLAPVDLLRAFVVVCGAKSSRIYRTIDGGRTFIQIFSK
jgi:hypothetical protein